MIVLLYFDWFGAVEELKEMEGKMIGAFARTDGVEYKGRYAPDNRKFHFANMFETKSYEKVLESLQIQKCLQESIRS